VVAAPFALVDATTWCDDFDWTAWTNKVTLGASVDELDVTGFGGGGFRSRIGGLKDVEVSYEGFQEDGTAAIGPELFPDLGIADRAWTVSPTGVAGTAAYLFQAGKFKVSQFGEVGGVAPFSVNAKGTNTQGLVRGQVAAAKQNKSSTGVLGSVLTLTAPTATQFVYCTVHVFSAATTITLQLQSDDAVGFPSATTRATIGPLTTVGGTWMTRVAGPFASEAYWRLNVSAITGTFSIAAAIAVQ
jgi:hypothetical protein